MKINWLLRFKNPTTVISLITLAVAFVYDVLGILEIVPKISENQILEILDIVIKLIAALGIVVDPTTKGINDSERALGYTDLGGN